MHGCVRENLHATLCTPECRRNEHVYVLGRYYVLFLLEFLFPSVLHL